MNQSRFLTDRMHFYASGIQMLRGLKGETVQKPKNQKSRQGFLYVTSAGFTKVNNFPRGEEYPLPVMGSWSSFASKQHLPSEDTDAHHFKEILITVYIFSCSLIFSQRL